MHLFCILYCSIAFFFGNQFVMLFNSLEFFVFFPLVTGVYFALPHKHRWWWLLLASCVFYMFFIPVYILILLITILIDYWAGIRIEESQGKARKSYLIISIISTCLILCIFKYFNFFNDNVGALAHLVGWNYPITALKLILPIGLSFHTFQSLSYVVEVYRGNQKAERHFGIYSLYVMFYPQLVAGPIERPQNVIYQFYKRHSFNYELATSGLKLMAWGFFKKLVIADRIAPLVNQVYNNPNESFGWQIILATLLFAIQIYCDFSGYSDIAIGSARVMGFKLMKNFDRPYFSKSISEFWSRWHISLSSWFRDYVYIPLGGNRVVKWRWYYNLMITFLLSGLWHGANWNFIIWGGLHGTYLIIGAVTKQWRAKQAKAVGLLQLPYLHQFVQVIFNGLLVSLAWVFFRANSVHDAFTLLRNMTLIEGKQLNLHILGNNYFALFSGIFFILLMEIVHLMQRGKNLNELIAEKPALVRWSLYVIFIAMLLNFGVFDSQGFIYFQF